MDKQINQLSKSSFFDEEDDDEEQELGFDGFHLRGWSSMDCIDTAKVTPERVGNPCQVPLIIHVNRKMKEHADNLMHAVQGLSARLTQLETRAWKMENAVDDVKVSIEFNHGRTEKRLSELQGIVKEVQGSIQDMRDKQEIAEAQLQLQLTKLTVAKSEKQMGKRNCPSQTNLGQEALSSVLQHRQQPLPNSVACPSPPTGIAPNQPHQYFLPTSAAMAPQLLSQSSQNSVASNSQPEPYYLPPRTASETTHQHYHQFSTKQMQPPLLPALRQPHIPALQQPPVSQMSEQLQMHLPFSLANSQALQGSLSHQPEVSYIASESTYKSSVSPFRPPLTHQFYADYTQQQIIDEGSCRRYSELPPGYSQLSWNSNPNNLYPDTASPSPYSAKTSEVHTSPNPTGGNGYLQLPTAKLLPHALPTASGVDSGTDSGASGKRVPVDDVVDKIVAMGFRRDLVRATVRKLTENGQSVDFNVVLDTLTNSRVVQP